MVCDWPDAVKAIKPFCESTQEKPEIIIGEWKTDPVTTVKPIKLVSSTVKPQVVTTPKTWKTKPYLTACDPAVPHIEHPYSCYKFLHCVPDLEGKYYYVEKTCNPPTMYHPISMVCEWPESVFLVKSKCGSKPEEPEPDWEETVIIEETIIYNKTVPAKNVSEEIWTLCQDGFVWSECAYPCGFACKYYKYLLFQSGFCQRDSDPCVPGCIPATSAKDCRPSLWRDSQTCVDIVDCTCLSENNQPIKV